MKLLLSVYLAVLITISGAVLYACQDPLQAETSAALALLEEEQPYPSGPCMQRTHGYVRLPEDVRISTGDVGFCQYFSSAWTQDVEPRPDGVSYGSGHFVPGQRTAYHTACAVFQHQDPPNHGPVDVARVCFTKVEFAPNIHDWGLNESGGNAEPYPYEPEIAITQFDTSRPGGCIGVFHRRPDVDTQIRQLLLSYCIDMSREIQWYYQHQGTFFGVRGGTVQYVMQWTALSAGEDDGPPRTRYQIGRCDVTSPFLYPNRRDGSTRAWVGHGYACPA